MKILISAICAAAILVFGGCQKPVWQSELRSEPAPRKQSVSQPEPRFLDHTVRWPGETLSHIAQWYTGKLQHWESIAVHNRTIDLNSLHKGDVVRIPVSILITRREMPKEFIHPPPAKQRPPTVKAVVRQPRAVTPPAIPESPTLFDPVESPGVLAETLPVPAETSLEEAELFEPIE